MEAFQSIQALQVCWVLGSSWSLNIWLTRAKVWGKPSPCGQELRPNSRFGMGLEFWAVLGGPCSGSGAEGLSWPSSSVGFSAGEGSAPQALPKPGCDTLAKLP